MSPRTAPVKPSRSRARGVVSNPPPDPCKPCSLMDHWNTLPGLHRKHLRPDTRIYQDASKLLNRLCRTPPEKLFTLDPDWMDQRRGMPGLVSRPLGRERVEQGLEALAMATSLESPLGTGLLKYLRTADLPSLIYNPRTRKSMFLQFLLDPAKPARKVTAGPQRVAAEPDEREAVDVLIAVLAKRRRGEEPQAGNKALTCLEKIRAWRSRVVPEWREELPHSPELLYQYGCFLDDWEPCYLPTTLDKTGPGSTSWARFCEKYLSPNFCDGVALATDLPEGWEPEKYTRAD